MLTELCIQEDVPLLRLGYPTSSGEESTPKPHDVLISEGGLPQFCFTCRGNSCRALAKTTAVNLLLTEPDASKGDEAMNGVLALAKLLKPTPPSCIISCPIAISLFSMRSCANA